MMFDAEIVRNNCTTDCVLSVYAINYKLKLAATLRWFMAGAAIRIVVRQLSQTWKLGHYDVITRKL